MYRLISLVLSAILAFAGTAVNTVDSVLDSVTQMIYGLPFTDYAVESDFLDLSDDSDIEKLTDGLGYARDTVIVFLKSDVGFKEKRAVFEEYADGGIVVGWYAPASLYVVKYPFADYNTLIAKSEKLSENENVAYAGLSYARQYESQWTPNDPFDPEEENIWDEASPAGANWWLEAINARQAWDYSQYFKSVRLGVVDSGFYTEQPDLKGKIFFPDYLSAWLNSWNYHGSHVAGIIAAQADNGVGVAGVCQTAELICCDWQPSALQFWIEDLAIFFSIGKVIRTGAKAVNLSFGLVVDGEKAPWYFVSSDATIYSIYMASLLDKGYDFVIVQSAGNGNADGKPIDSVNNGTFASITPETVTNYGYEHIPTSELLDRIIIVAAAENLGEGNYRLSSYSNTGKYVSIAAPGENIYSCVNEDDAYYYLSGTSMAAPVVTGVCGLVWSVNPSFTGKQVKEIVCSSTKDVAQKYVGEGYYTSVEYRDIPMVNAQLAVEKAIEYIH